MPVFAHVTDLHLRPPGVLTLGAIDAERHAAAAIDALIERHGDVDAVLVTGDVADLGEEGAYERATSLLSRLSAPVFVAPGNHDGTQALRRAFATWPGIGAGDVANKICQRATIDGVDLVMLDTSVDRVAVAEHHGTLGDEQLAWLDRTLAACGPTLIAMHHPPFGVGIAFMDDIGLTDAAAFADILARHDNVRRIVCGHVHRVIVGEVAGVTAMAIPGVAHQVELALGPDAPARLVMEPPAYGIHLFAEERVVSHVGYVDDFGPATRFTDGKSQAEAAQ